jgi:polyhydroxybutyrate depolymerase
MRALTLVAIALVVIATCGCSGSTMRDAGSDGAVHDTIGPDDRPAHLTIPPAYDGTTPLPAIVLLHGEAMDGASQDAYFGICRAASTFGFYVVLPDGTIDATGQRFWNATPACCNSGGIDIDDVAYLTSLVDELEATVPVSDLYFVGYSNGGFMSYRMACELADRVTAIVSVAGSDFPNDTDCVPSRTVSVLSIHGDADSVIAYDGLIGAYPSARAVVERWAARAGCGVAPSEPDVYLDLDTMISGPETEVIRYLLGCTGTDNAALWTIRGGDHAPRLGTTFAPTILAWLLQHTRAG